MKALITGASSGIGRDMAIDLAKREYDLVLVARSEERLNKLKEEINGFSKVNVEVISMDLTIEENCKEIHNKVKNVDILINNAGFGDCGKFENTDLDKDLNMIKTNITALHILTKLYLKDMKEMNSGKILNVASVAGFMPGPLMATYYSSKAYVVRLSESIREELRRDKSNVQISILCPGPVDTNFNNTANVVFSLKGATSKEIAEYAIKKMLKGKFYIIPGFGVKSAIFFRRFVSSKALSKFTYNAQKSKIER